MQNPYEILEISADATYDEIKRKYHKLAIKVHPDLNPDDPLAVEKFKDISWAYSKLINPLERNKIDRKFGVKKNDAKKDDSFINLKSKEDNELNIKDAEYSEINRRNDFKAFYDDEYFENAYNKILHKKHLKYLISVFMFFLSLILVSFVVSSVYKSKKGATFADLKLSPVAHYKNSNRGNNGENLSDNSDLYYSNKIDKDDKSNMFVGCKIANPKEINKNNKKYLKYNVKEKLWYFCIK
ncbi:MAG: DnaJ domain-containing protein [Alphaproteobacteria bacterium]|nr:DnaJ domain-containing protein [Alphaproteobacteria bacterium]